MKYLSFIRSGEIQQQIETTLSDEQAIEIDEMLRRAELFGEDEELAVTERV